MAQAVAGGTAAIQVSLTRQLKDFTLDVAFTSREERLVLFGPSGGGKSMTLQMIAGTRRPEAGRIVVGGRLLYDAAEGVSLPARLRNVGYVPQGYALFPHLTVEDNIGFGLRGSPRSARAERVREMIALTGLAGLEGRRPSDLSGGQRQRVALARALAVQPHILLLDEPFSALDTPLRLELREQIIMLQARTGVPLVAVTHDLADAFQLGQRIVVIDRGRVLQQGTREEVFFRPAHRRIAELVGTRNILPCRVTSVEGGTVHLDWGGRRLESLAGARTDALAPGQSVAACVRPTQIMIRLPQRSYEGRRNVLEGRIIDEILGAETYRLFVRLTGSSQASDLELELPGYAYARLGLESNKDIEMSVKPEAVHLIAEP
jgi:ABC-type Fe3+/spermidine/putrescine transport system ATPase subunit